MADFTSTSGSYFGYDDSIGIGEEVTFTGQDRAEKTFDVPNAGAYEIYGTIAMRAEGKSDVLVRLFLDERLVFNANLKLRDRGAYNLWCYVAPAGLKVPATVLKVHVDAAGAGDAWPVNCELELCGRWS